MGSFLSKVRTMSAEAPPRILIYGSPGVGKTTFASEFPNAIFLQIEDGTPADCEITTGGKLKTYDDVTNALGELYMDDHDFKTVVIDSVTELHSLIADETCLRGDGTKSSYATLEEFPYGKGQGYAMKVWREFMTALNMLRDDRNMTVVMISHIAITPFNDPENPAYDRYTIALPHNQKNAEYDIRGFVQRECDAIFLLKKDVVIKAEDKSGVASKNDKTTARVRATGGQTNLLCTVELPSMTAKNRYGMPAQIRIDKGAGYEAVAPYFPKIKTQSQSQTQEKE